MKCDKIWIKTTTAQIVFQNKLIYFNILSEVSSFSTNFFESYYQSFNDFGYVRIVLFDYESDKRLNIILYAFTAVIVIVKVWENNIGHVYNA